LVVDENDATTPTVELALQPKVLNSNDEGADEEKDVENSEEEEVEEGEEEEEEEGEEEKEEEQEDEQAKMEEVPQVGIVRTKPMKDL
jgi:hypothetical protein